MTHKLTLVPRTLLEDLPSINHNTFNQNVFILQKLNHTPCLDSLSNETLKVRFNEQMRGSLQKCISLFLQPKRQKMLEIYPVLACTVDSER